MDVLTLLGSQIDSMQKLQAASYSFQPALAIMNFLQSGIHSISDENLLYQLSLRTTPEPKPAGKEEEDKEATTTANKQLHSSASFDSSPSSPVKKRTKIASTWSKTLSKNYRASHSC